MLTKMCDVKEMWWDRKKKVLKGEKELDKTQLLQLLLSLPSLRKRGKCKTREREESGNEGVIRAGIAEGLILQ